MRYYYYKRLVFSKQSITQEGMYKPTPYADT